MNKFLTLLKTKGALSTQAIATALTITGEGARFQLLKLSEDGLVQAVTENKGIGRPLQIWRLTAKGHKYFPDIHDELSVQLIDSIRETLGQQAVAAIIHNREKKATEKYQNELKEITDLEQKIDRLVAIRTSEGYYAEREKKDTGYLLKENHCPICAAATNCPDFCASELNTFQNVLGENVTITRVQHILQGAAGCAYQIEIK